MDLTRQTDRAADIHTRYLVQAEGYTCIDCHKGIAHELPNMQQIDPGWLPPQELRAGLGFRATATGPGTAGISDYLARSE